MMDHLEEEFVDIEENLVEEIATNINSQEQMQHSQIIGRGEGRGGSDMFQVNFKKSKQPNANGLYEVTCNYCQKIYEFSIGGGYGTFRRHLTTKHPNQLGVEKQQTQISGYTCSSSNSSQLFKYSDETNKVELAKMISMEHLSFNFGVKVGLVNYCQNTGKFPK